MPANERHCSSRPEESTYNCEQDASGYARKSVIKIMPELAKCNRRYSLINEFTGIMKHIAKNKNGTNFSSFVSVSHRKLVSQITKKLLQYQYLVLMLAAFSAGCATNNSKAVRDDGRQVQENIEISEDYSVDSEIRDEFREAVTLMKQEQYPEAIKKLRSVTAKSKRFSSPYINLGIAYSRMDDMALAEENLMKALKLNEMHPVANNELALIYRRTGRFTDARATYEKLLAKYPTYLPARKNLGVLCDIYLQDLNCALKQYEFYLGYLPDDKQVKIWVADVKSRM